MYIIIYLFNDNPALIILYLQIKFRVYFTGEPRII